MVIRAEFLSNLHYNTEEIEVVMKEKIGYNLLSVFCATTIWKTGYKEEVK